MLLFDDDDYVHDLCIRNDFLWSIKVKVILYHYHYSDMISSKWEEHMYKFLRLKVIKCICNSSDTHYISEILNKHKWKSMFLSLYIIYSLV